MQQTQAGSAIAVTFILAFEPQQARLPAVVDALVRGAPELLTECEGLYQHWHASWHFKLGVLSELWFRFRCTSTAAQALVMKGSECLRVMSGTYGFVLKDAIAETEARAFGEGDLRKDYDKVTEIGGPQNLPKLWTEVQQATEWAIADLPSRTLRSSLPPTWFKWSGHIYRNLLGLNY